MARYVLKLMGKDEYLYSVNSDKFIETTDKPNKAKVYSDSMLEENRIQISNEVKSQFGTRIEVVRIL